MHATLQRSGTLIITFALALATGACGKKQAGPPPTRSVMVNLATAVKVDSPVIVTAYGTTQDRENVDIVPQVSGLLLAILVPEGAVVTNGQPLFQIDSRDYQMRVQQAEGMVAVDQSSLGLARSTLGRNQPLLEKQLISQDAFDTIKTKVAALEAQLKMDEAALDQARLNLSRCTIVSPLAGICSKRYVDAGNLVAAGMTRLINIRSYNPLRLECAVSEQYLPVIRRAMSGGSIAAEITPRGETNSYPATLSFMDNAVNPTTGTIVLRGDVPNPGMKLWANQFVDIRITVDTVPGAILVPESAVQFGKTGPYLYIADAHHLAVLRPVKLGIRSGDQIQIAEGVAEGDTVIALGQLMLYPGATVMDPSKMPPKTEAPTAKP